MRRTWLLVLGIGLLPGCLRHREDVPPGTIANITATLHEPAPPVSPYDARGAAPSKDDSQPTPAVRLTGAEEVKPAEATPAVIRDPLELTPSTPPAALPVLPPSTATPPPARAAEPPEDPLVRAFRCCRENRPLDDCLKNVDPATREVLTVLLPLAARLGEKARRVDSLIEPLEALLDTLRAKAPLTIEKLCYCREIEGFGAYDPLPADHCFQRGGEGRPGEQVLLYVELKNFLSRHAGAAHETALACTMTLRDSRSLVVWRQDLPAKVKRSLSPRRDCYLPCYFRVPAGLPVGDYVLTLQVTDMTAEEVTAQRVATRLVDFHVGCSAR